MISDCGAVRVNQSIREEGDPSIGDQSIREEGGNARFASEQFCSLKLNGYKQPSGLLSEIAWYTLTNIRPNLKERFIELIIHLHHTSIPLLPD